MAAASAPEPAQAATPTVEQIVLSDRHPDRDRLLIGF
jgi:hypothetical protein